VQVIDFVEETSTLAKHLWSRGNVFLELKPVLFKEFVVKCFFFISLTGLLAVFFYLIFEMHPPQLAY
jgi:hypothetical protein